MSDANNEILEGFLALLEAYPVIFTYTGDVAVRTGVFGDSSDASPLVRFINSGNTESATASFLRSDWPTLPKVNQAIVNGGVKYTINKVRNAPTSPILDLEVSIS